MSPGGPSALIAVSKTAPVHFGGLLERYADEIYGYIARRLGAEAAPDLVAEVFLVAFRGRMGFDAARGLVRPWLYGIAIHVISRHRRTGTSRMRPAGSGNAAHSSGRNGWPVTARAARSGATRRPTVDAKGSSRRGPRASPRPATTSCNGRRTFSPGKACQPARPPSTRQSSPFRKRSRPRYHDIRVRRGLPAIGRTASDPRRPLPGDRTAAGRQQPWPDDRPPRAARDRRRPGPGRGTPGTHLRSRYLHGVGNAGSGDLQVGLGQLPACRHRARLHDLRDRWPGEPQDGHASSYENPSSGT